MPQTTANSDPINITPDVEEDIQPNPPKKNFFLERIFWLFFIFTGLSIGYYAWDSTQHQSEIAFQAEIVNVKQEIEALKKSYSELIQEQTSSPSELSKKVTALEEKLHNFSRASMSKDVPLYLQKIITLIALKDIVHKIKAGATFGADIQILNHIPSTNIIDLPKIQSASNKRFETLEQLGQNLRIFEDYVIQKKEADKSLITQMGDFLKITKSDETETEVQISQAIEDAEAAIDLDDVEQAQQILRASFPDTDDATEAWFRDATSYLEGRDLREQIEGWASQLFAPDEAAEEE